MLPLSVAIVVSSSNLYMSMISGIRRITCVFMADVRADGDNSARHKRRASDPAPRGWLELGAIRSGSISERKRGGGLRGVSSHPGYRTRSRRIGCSPSCRTPWPTFGRLTPRTHVAEGGAPCLDPKWWSRTEGKPGCLEHACREEGEGGEGRAATRHPLPSAAR